MKFVELKPTFRDLIYVGLLIISAALFIRGNSDTTQANTVEIVKVKKDVASNAEDIKINFNNNAAQDKIDNDRAGEMIRLKNDLQFVSDVVESVALKVGAEIPMKKVTE